MKQTWSMIDNYPPPLVRCLARRNGKGKHLKVLSDQEIAIEADIPVDRIKQIYNSPTWSPIPVGEMRRFCGACGFDPSSGQDRNRVNAYVNQKKGPQWTFLRRSPYWPTIFRPLLLKLRDSANGRS